MRPLRELAQNLALSVASLLAFGGGAEVVCRLTEPAKPRYPMAELILDWQGWDGEFYTVKSTAVGQPPWEDYNQDGLRDREHDVEKPPGVRRLVVLGDSTTFGFWLSSRDAYPQVLQDLLDARGRRFEVFNVALPGWTTRQELIAYRRIARKYLPDQVLLAICLNDVPEMQNNLTRPPAFVMSLFKRSALVRRVVLSGDREIQDEMEMLRNMDSPKVRQGFELMFTDLRKLRAEVRADGAGLGLVILPFRFQFRPDALPPLVQKRVLDFCQVEAIPCLDLLPPLRGLGEAAFQDFDHFSAAGSRLVAEEILGSGFLFGGEAPAPTPPARPVGDLIAALQGSDTKARMEAAWVAGEAVGAHDALVPVLLRSLGSVDPLERAGAAWSLGRLGPEAAAAVSPLVDRLDDEDDAVSWRAVSALAQINPEPQVELGPLIRLLQEPSGRGRAHAAELVGRLGSASQAAVAALTSALADPRESVRWRAAWALGQVGPAAAPAVPALVGTLVDPEIRWRVADALGQIGEAAGAAVPALLPYLDDASSSVRWRVVQALGRIGSAARPVTSALVRRTTDPDMNVRLAALRALEQIGAEPGTAVAAYRRALRDEDRRVRTQSANALGRLGPVARDAASDLLWALRDEDPGVRAKAARALGRLGIAAPAVWQALSAAARDPDERVHAAATKALSRLATIQSDDRARR